MTQTPPLEHCLLAATRLDALIERVHALGPAMDLTGLASAWEKARSTMRSLADSEAGCADASALLPMPATMAAAVDAFTSSATGSQSFAAVPVAFGLVEYEALMVSRPALWSDRLLACGAWMEGADRSDERLAACCLAPETAVQAAVVQSAWLDGTWTVVTEDPQASLRVEAATCGELAALSLQLRVVSPPPVVHVARYRGRHLLVDGHHRVRALRHLGVSFVPAVVSACETLDDVVLAAPHLADVDVARWFAQVRPPLLRDHDRPSLVYSYPAMTSRRLLKLRCNRAWTDAP